VAGGAAGSGLTRRGKKASASTDPLVSSRAFMRCPFCHKPENKVIDSRESHEGHVIRRRRECLDCTRRFTTYERVEEIMPLVVKKDGRREAFDRDKVLAGLKKAVEKRPVSSERLEQVIAEIEQRLQEMGEKEVPTTVIGEKVMQALQGIDDVAYVRFASVYRSFRDISEFMDELKGILNERSLQAPAVVVAKKKPGRPA
jgi:transcriptional repressor NrdR